jgi:hypothetical protein
MNREELEKPFDPGRIRQREGDDGKMYDYIPGPFVIQRLSEIFGTEWSYEIIEFKILDDEVIALGKLLAGGVEKMQFGAVPITRRKSDKKPVSIGDDLKKAGTDGLKKCAELLGIGLHLKLEKLSSKTKETARAPRAATPRASGKAAPFGSAWGPERKAAATTPSAAAPPSPAASDSDRVTARQLAAITTLSQKRGWTGLRLRDYAMENYRCMPDHLTKDQASSLITRLQLQQAVAS